MRSPSSSTPTTFLTAEAARAEIARQATELQVLHQVRLSLSDTERPGDIIRQAVESLSGIVGYAHVGAYQVRDQDLRLVHQIGYDAPIEFLSLDAGICGYVARTGEPVLVADTSRDPRYLAVLESVSSEVCVPFGTSDGLRGVLNVEGDEARPLTVDDLRIVQDIAGMLTIAIERAELRIRQRATERRLELALSAGEVGVWTWNPKSGQIEWIIGPDHPLARLLPEQTTVQEFLNLLDAGDVGHGQHSFALAVTTGHLDVEFRLVDPSGVAIWVSLHGQTVLRDIAGDPAEISGVITDITGRKRLEEERLRLMHLETARINAEEAQRVMMTTIDRLADGFVSFDPDGKVLMVNTAACDLLGVDKDAAIGVEMAEIFASVGSDQGRVDLIQACTRPEATSFDLLDMGTGRILDIRVFPADDGTTVHVRDVTSLRTAEYQRHRAENRFRSLVQQAFEVVVVMDRDGTITYISPAVERVLGYTPAELDHVDVQSLIHPQDQDRMRSLFLRILRVPDYVLDMEFRVANKEGTYRWLDMTLTNLLGDPSIQGVVANCRDVSERHAADFSMWLLSEVSSVVGRTLDVGQTIESLNQLLVGSYADVSLVAVLDEQGNEIRRNCACASDGGIRPDDVGGLLDACRAALEVPFGGEQPGQNTLVIGASEAGDPGIPVEFRVVAEHLAAIELASIVIAPITLRRSLRGLLVVSPHQGDEATSIDVEMIEDIARRAGLAIDNAELYEHAREAIQARDRFLSVAAHELRTPITSITGYATMLRKELEERKDPERLRRYASRVDEAGRQIASLAEDLLDITRIRSGQMPLRMGNVDLAELIGSIVKRYSEQIESARDRLDFEQPDGGTIVFGDSERLTQVVTNLVDNGLKYSPAPSQVSVTLAEAGDWVTLQVSDTGIGVPVGELQQIFDPFGRATNAARGDVPGLGLGLYICKTIVERHGGKISASSEGPGTGLTVTVRLPSIHSSGTTSGPI